MNLFETDIKNHYYFYL